METKFKINQPSNKINYTQLVGNAFLQVQHDILHKAGISKFQWNMLLFESGCALVEQVYTHAEAALQELREKKYGFWDWYIVKFLQHDEHLLQENDSISANEYYTLKMQFIHSPELIEKFINRD